MNIDPANLTRSTHISGTLIRRDGLVCTFGATSWLDFCRMASEQADGLWGRDGGIARVFGCEEGGELAELPLAKCRPLVGADGLRSRWVQVANLSPTSRACRASW